MTSLELYYAFKMGDIEDAKGKTVRRSFVPMALWTKSGDLEPRSRFFLAFYLETCTINVIIGSFCY